MMKTSKTRQPGSKIDLIIAILLIVVSILVRLPTINYPIDGDAVAYAELTKNLVEKGDYSFEGKFHTQFPPFFPISSVPAYLILNDAALAVKWTSTVFAALSITVLYLFLRKLDLSIKIATILASSVLFNPWFVYFTSIGYSEGLAIFLLTCSLFFFYFREENERYKYYSATFIGLGSVTKASFIPFLLTFAIFYLYSLFKHKKKENISLIIISAIPIAILSIINFYKSSSLAYGGYSSWLATVQNIHLNILVYLVVMPITLLFLTPMLINALYRMSISIKQGWRRNKAGYVILAGSLLYLAVITWASFDLKTFGALENGRINLLNLYAVVFSLPRYIIPLLPFFTMVAFFEARKKYQDIFIKSSPFILLILFALCVIINYGFVQDAIDEAAHFPDTIMRRNEHRIQAIDWVNTHAERGAQVINDMGEPKTSASMVRLDRFINDKFREDLTIKQKDANIAPGMPTYLITEKEPGKQDIPAQNMKLVYETEHKPPVAVYKR